MSFAAAIRYGTVSVPLSVASPGTDSGREGYLVLNIEFNATYYLYGYEFYAANAGSVKTAVIEINKQISVLVLLCSRVIFFYRSMIGRIVDHLLATLHVRLATITRTVFTKTM